MSQVNTSPVAHATAVAETVTLTFDNRMPLRVRQPIHGVWLGYAYLDFGGRRVKYCRRAAGGLHVWYRYTTPYTDGRSYDRYIGHADDALSMSDLLERCDEIDFEDAGAVLVDMQDEGYIELPIQ